MMDSTDMSTPVTRGELQDVLSQVQQEHWRGLRETTAPLAAQAELQGLQNELEMWGGTLMACIQRREERLANLERGQEQLIGLVQQTQQQIQQTEQRLVAELARHTAAIHEGMRTQIKASTEPFDDLPGRVSRLETEVFGPRTARAADAAAAKSLTGIAAVADVRSAPRRAALESRPVLTARS